MSKFNLCCVGHITKDKNITPESVNYMAGGTAFYFSWAVRHFDDVSFLLKTIIGRSEKIEIEKLRAEKINVSASFCDNSIHFENIYENNYETRKQHVFSKAEPFTIELLQDIDADIVHLGPLLADDFSVGAMRFLAEKSLVSVDCQGFLRMVNGIDVFPVSWDRKDAALPYIHFLKASRQELMVLTGTKDIIAGIVMLGGLGVKEVIVTLGGAGSIIYNGEKYFLIPAYKPQKVLDTTGCGDTYMAGYLYQRVQGTSIEDAGRFAAAMAALKTENYGPFSGNKNDVLNCIKTYRVISLPVL